MHTFTADPALQQSLVALPGLTEVCDASGQVLGFFSPAGKIASEMYTEAAAHLDPAEKDRRKQSGEKGRTTADVLAHLESIDK